MAVDMQWKPNVTVAAIAEREGRFLVVEENSNGRIVINQPAGHLEKNETLIEAVRREVLEETAWQFNPESIVGLYMHTNLREDITYLRVCFSGTCERHFPENPLDDGIVRALWMTREELEASQERMRSKMVLRCIHDYQSGKRFPLDILNHYL